jgi:ankyrin repeat protein
MTMPDTSAMTSRLSEALRTGNYTLLKRLIDAGADVNTVIDAHGRTALVQAVATDMTIGALLLIERGAMVGKTAAGVTPLIIAASKGNERVCRALLDAGAPIDDCYANGNTALYEAVARSFPSVCRLLAERGANVHVETAFASSPLHVAAMSSKIGAADIVRILVAAGASPSRLLSRAQQDGNVPLSAFQVALVHGKIDHVRYFLHECGEDPAQATEDGRTMLDLASTPVMTELLLATIAERAISSAIDTDVAAQPPASKSKGFSPL